MVHTCVNLLDPGFEITQAKIQRPFHISDHKTVLVKRQFPGVPTSLIPTLVIYRPMLHPKSATSLASSIRTRTVPSLINKQHPRSDQCPLIQLFPVGA